MNFLRKLFGKQKSVEDQVKDLIKNFELKIEVTSTSHFKTEQEIIEDSKLEDRIRGYNITEIKKQATQVKNKEGLLAAINFLKAFIETKNIEFDELIKILKVIIDFSVKENSISEEKLLEYLNKQIEKYPEKDIPLKQLEIYKIYDRFNDKIAFNYLEDVLRDYNSDITKSPDYIDLFMELSKVYLKQRQADKAFQTLQRANNLTTKIIDSFYFTWKLARITEAEAEICLKGGENPQYADYLHYEIVAFIMFEAWDITKFPYFDSFIRRRDRCKQDDELIDSDEFNQALEFLKISKHRQALMRDIYNFTYIELPTIMGIPKEFQTEIPDNAVNDKDILVQIPIFGKINDEINKKSRFVGALAHKFTRETVKKYYDMEN